MDSEYHNLSCQYFAFDSMLLKESIKVSKLFVFEAITHINLYVIPPQSPFRSRVKINISESQTQYFTPMK